MNSLVIVPLDTEYVAFVNGPTYTREEILSVMSCQNSNQKKNYAPTPDRSPLIEELAKLAIIFMMMGAIAWNVYGYTKSIDIACAAYLFCNLLAILSGDI